MRIRPWLVVSCLLVSCGDDGPIVGSGSSSSSSSSGAQAEGSTTAAGTTEAPTTAASSSGPADTTAGVSVGTSTTEAGTSSSGDPSTTTGDPPGSSGSSGSSGTTGDESTGTTGGTAECQPTYPDGDMLCGDGMVVAGELCYELQPPLDDAGTFARRVWAGDLDDDGDADALVLVEFPAAMTVLLNDGLGNLTPDDTYGLVMGANEGSNDVAVGDMDEDTWVDAVVAFASPPSLLVLDNDGGGAFGFPIVTALPQAPLAVAVADLDGDFFDDAIVSDAVGVTVHYGLGNGSFGMAAQLADPALAQGRDLVLHDFDDDGDLDVAVAFTQTVAVYLNAGGVLMAPSTAAVATSAFGPNDIAVGDVTADGVPDILVADALEEEIHVLAGLGNGTFVPDPVPLQGRFVVVGDANADCNDDVLTRNDPLMFDELTVYPGDGMGGFGAPTSFLLHSGMVDMEGADFDGDTLVDVLFAIGPTGEVGVSRTQP